MRVSRSLCATSGLDAAHISVEISYFHSAQQCDKFERSQAPPALSYSVVSREPIWLRPTPGLPMLAMPATILHRSRMATASRLGEMAAGISPFVGSAFQHRTCHVCPACFRTILILAASDLMCRYEGEWVDDMMTGRGYMVWADGRRYDGEWFENRCNGRGVLTYKDGRRYEVRGSLTSYRID